MIVDFRINKPLTLEPIVIKGENVETVSQYKYLGVVFDEQLSWKENTVNILKKSHPRMFFLRKLKSFNVNENILQNFYTSIIQSVLSFGVLCWKCLWI